MDTPRPARGRRGMNGGQVDTYGVPMRPGDVITARNRARRGMGRSFQRTNLFPRLTVLENLRLAAAAGERGRYDLLGRVEGLRAPLERARRAGEAVGLSDRLAEPAGRLSYGEQRQLEVGVVLATDPKLMLLDEPTAGISPEETARMTRMLEGLPREVTVLIIEHDMDVVGTHILEVAERMAERIGVIAHGRLIAEGTLAELSAQAGHGGTNLEEIFLSLTADTSAGETSAAA